MPAFPDVGLLAKSCKFQNTRSVTNGLNHAVTLKSLFDLTITTVPSDFSESIKAASRRNTDGHYHDRILCKETEADCPEVRITPSLPKRPLRNLTD